MALLGFMGLIVAVIIISALKEANTLEKADERKREQEKERQREEQQKRQQEEKLERLQAQKEQIQRDEERKIAPMLQETALKISKSAFYQELWSCVTKQVQKDVEECLSSAYNSYMKMPGATPDGFKPFPYKRIEPSHKMHIYSLRGSLLVLTVTANGVEADYCHHFTSEDKRFDKTIDEYVPNIEIFNCIKRGYSQLTPMQIWVLAQMLSRDLGYEMESYRFRKYPEDAQYTGSHRCRDTLSEAAFYLRKTKTGGYIDLKPVGQTGYLAQAIVSETQKLQASGISYKASV